MSERARQSASPSHEAIVVAPATSILKMPEIDCPGGSRFDSGRECLETPRCLAVASNQAMHLSHNLYVEDISGVGSAANIVVFLTLHWSAIYSSPCSVHEKSWLPLAIPSIYYWKWSDRKYTCNKANNLVCLAKFINASAWHEHPDLNRIHIWVNTHWTLLLIAESAPEQVPLRFLRPHLRRQPAMQLGRRPHDRRAKLMLHGRRKLRRAHPSRHQVQRARSWRSQDQSALKWEASLMQLCRGPCQIFLRLNPKMRTSVAMTALVHLCQGLAASYVRNIPS